MTTLPVYLSELGALLKQLEASVAAGESASGGQLFEWRIRARIIEDKLIQAAKPPREPNPEDETVEEKPTLVFSAYSTGCAQRALAHANGLREAIRNRRLKVALESARAIERLTT